MAEKTAAELAAENVDDDHAPGAGEDDALSEGDAGESDGADADEGHLDQGDGSEEGESEEDAAEVDDAEEAPPAAATLRKASDVIRAEKKARKEAEARIAERERERDEARRETAEARRRAEDAERRASERRERETADAEAARVELMSESEKIAHYRQKDQERNDRRFNELQFQNWDNSDRSDFRQLCREDPLVAKVKDKVEAEYERLKTAGRPVSREILANQEIAKMVREQRTKAGSKPRERAEAGVRRETTRPPRTRSDAVAERRTRGTENTAEARRKRLEDVIL